MPLKSFELVLDVIRSRYEKTSIFWWYKHGDQRESDYRSLGLLNQGLTEVYSERKGKMGLDVIHIFEIEPMEPAKWWVVEIEGNRGIENKAEVLSFPG